MNIVELFATIGLKADTSQAERFLGTTKAIGAGLVAAGAAATGFMVAIGKITQEATKAALEFQRFETDTGGSAQALQRWQAVAEQTSGAGNAVAASIRAIALNQEKIKMGQGNLSGYQLLGIDPTSDPFEVLEALRTKTDGLSQSMKRNIMSQFGISTDLLATIDLTSDAFDKLAGKAFVINPGTIESINKARAAGAQLAQGISYIKAQITANLAPAMVELSNAASEFIRLNKDDILAGTKKVFDWIVRFSQAIGNAATMINRIVQGTIGWANALKVIVGIIALMNASFLASPLGLFIAGIVLLVALLDDIMVYQSGKGRSLIGVLFEKFPEMEGKLLSFADKTKEAINGAVESIKTMIDFVSDLSIALLDLIADRDWSSLDEFAEKWGMIGRIVLKTVEALVFLQKLFEPTEGALVAHNQFWENVEGKGASGLFSELASDWNKYWKEWKEKEEKEGGFFGALKADWNESWALWTSGIKREPESPSTTVNVNAPITVNGAANPETTGAAVEGAVTGAMKKAEQRMGRPTSR